MDLWRAGSCRWAVLSKAELEAHNAEIAKRVAEGLLKKGRATRSDKGTKRGRKNKTDDGDVDEDEDDKDDSESSDDEDARPARRAKASQKNARTSGDGEGNGGNPKAVQPLETAKKTAKKRATPEAAAEKKRVEKEAAAAKRAARKEKKAKDAAEKEALKAAKAAKRAADKASKAPAKKRKGKASVAQAKIPSAAPQKKSAVALAGTLPHAAKRSSLMRVTLMVSTMVPACPPAHLLRRVKKKRLTSYLLTSS